MNGRHHQLAMVYREMLMNFKQPFLIEESKSLTFTRIPQIFC